MSHTLVLKVDGFVDVRIHHNSDWSGVAIVRVERKFERPREISLPGEVFRAFGELQLALVRDEVADLAEKIGLKIEKER